MNAFTPLALASALVLVSCGSDSSLSSLSRFFNDTFGEGKTEKTRCTSEDNGFHVCLSEKSRLGSSELMETVAKSLEELNTLVDQESFLSEVSSHYTNGSGLAASLRATNYIVTVTGFCDANTATLARATVKGDTVSYNECQVSKDAAGNPILAHVAGVMLHEIAHNMGYDHDKTNPSPDSIPYYLGDLAEERLSGGTGQSSATANSDSYTDGESPSAAPDSQRTGRRGRRSPHVHL